MAPSPEHKTLSFATERMPGKFAGARMAGARVILGWNTGCSLSILHNFLITLDGRRSLSAALRRAHPDSAGLTWTPRTDHEAEELAFRWLTLVL
jgi:hypothetical protein